MLTKGAVVDTHSARWVLLMSLQQGAGPFQVVLWAHFSPPCLLVQLTTSIILFLFLFSGCWSSFHPLGKTDNNKWAQGLSFSVITTHQSAPTCTAHDNR